MFSLIFSRISNSNVNHEISVIPTHYCARSYTAKNNCPQAAFQTKALVSWNVRTVIIISIVIYWWEALKSWVWTQSHPDRFFYSKHQGALYQYSEKKVKYREEIGMSKSLERSETFVSVTNFNGNIFWWFY